MARRGLCCAGPPHLEPQRGQSRVAAGHLSLRPLVWDLSEPQGAKGGGVSGHK